MAAQQPPSVASVCSDSSSQFASIISTYVKSKCGSNPNTTVNQVMDVFVSYFRLEVSTTAAASSASSSYSSIASSASSSSISTTMISSASPTLFISTPIQTKSSTTATPTSAPANSLMSSPSSPTTVASSNGGSGSANTAAKVGIGICIPFAVIGIGIGAFFYLRHRRARKQGIAFPIDSMDNGGHLGMPQSPATSHSNSSFVPMPVYAKHEYDPSKISF
ncbi:uncharacterized protein K441DRAFT_365591 [Cenococcum geophilum 1.58]|uniref:uncharacterized protein n=1 Tax=Cenococcum geophilum 1.58 TaxID=794803 RepID=UPI00358FA185|nr:hypothetical protein K441DRAFT_365591 [Cenococcum geophilum 1.58]